MDGDNEIQEGAEVPSVGDATGESVQEQPLNVDTPEPVKDALVEFHSTPSTATHAPAPPLPESARRVANYVLASGVNMGATVAVFPLGPALINEESKQMFSDLALVDTPEIPYQTKAPYSDGKEPGTWHWA